MALATGLCRETVHRAKKALEIDPVRDSKGILVNKEGYFEFLSYRTSKSPAKYRILIPVTNESHVTNRSHQSDQEVISTVSNRSYKPNKEPIKEPINKKINKKRKELQEIAGDFHDMD